MSAAGSERSQAPILGTTYRSPWRVGWDLWCARGSFRGFAEFALIGAFVLSFLGTPGAPKVNDILRSVKKVTGIQGETTLPRESVTPFLSKNTLPLAPRMNEISFDARDFETVHAPLRAQLTAALAAYRQRQYQKALDLLNAAEPQDPLVLLMRGLSLIALSGSDTFQTGIGLLRQAANRGEAKAMAFLGLMTINGLPGLTRKVEEGRKLLEKSAQVGATDAFRILGEGYVSGWAGSVDPARAVEYLRTASDRGDTRATFRLGELYFVGRGMAQDHKEAERFFTLAANQGHTEAQALLGTWRLVPYMNGVTDDPTEALQWLERAAAQGEPHAMEYLGTFYAEIGKRTGMADLPRGVDWFRRCTEETLYADCVFAYATALDKGLGTQRDPVKAYALYAVVDGRGGSGKTTTRMSELRKELSSQDLERAHAITFEMWRKHPSPQNTRGRG